MQNNNKSYKIVIIEPSMIISTGLRKLIEMRNEFEVVEIIIDGSGYCRLFSLSGED